VEVAAAPDGVTDEGENAQVEFVGSPEQLSATAALKPPLGVIVTVLAAEAPLDSDAAAGDRARA
jgi:hypothetical protein